MQPRRILPDAPALPFPLPRRRGTLGELSSDWGDSRSGDRHGHCDPPPHFLRSAGGEQPVMIGWAYLIALIISIDGLLLGLLLLNVKWPKH